MTVIAHITPWYWDKDSVFGGAERYVHNIALAQRELFPDYRIYVRSIGRVSRVTTRSVDPSVLLYPEADPRVSAGRIIDELLRIDPPDVWHVHQHRSPFGMAVMFVLRCLGQRIVVTDLGWVEPWDTRIYRVSDLADLVIAISTYAADRDSTSTRKIVVKGGVKVASAPGDSFKDGLLYLGRILPHKGSLELVKAMPKGAPLVVAGAVTDRDYARAVKEICRKKGFLFFANPTDSEVAELRENVSLGLMPTLKGPGYEYMGLSALESFASGRPVVAVNSGGLAEFVAHNENGLLTESHEELAEQAISLLREPDRLWALRVGAIRSAKLFCCHSVSRRLHQEYLGLM